MTTEKHKCCGRTSNGFYGSACGKTAKVERNGKWYCGTHDPIAVAEKRAKRNAKWDAEWNARQEAEAKAIAKRKEQEHRAACFPELLEALKWTLARVERLAPHQAIEGDAALYEIAAARGAIQRAEGANT